MKVRTWLTAVQVGWNLACAHSQRLTATKNVRRFRPHVETLEDRTVPTAVGYYDMGLGTGNPTQVAAITRIGDTPVNITDLSPAQLSSINVLVVQNPNFFYSSTFTNELSNVWEAVSKGLVLVINDRYVAGAASILPGGQNFQAVQQFSQFVTCEDGYNLIVHGPAGANDNFTYTGYFWSNHGYLLASSLPANADNIFDNGTWGHIVLTSYPYGAGQVIYSTIPLDYWVAQNPNGPFATILAPNEVAYADSMVDYAPADVGASYTLNENTSVSGNLSATSPQSKPLTFAVGTGPQHGQVTITNTSTGAFTYTPNANYYGSDSFTFTATDGRQTGAIATVSLNVQKVNHPPVAVAGADQTGLSGKTFFFDGSGSSDPDGDPLSYQWDFGDKATASGMQVSHAYTAAGTYTVTLSVDDGQGGSSSSTLQVVVKNAQPVLSFQGQSLGVRGQERDFTGKFTDPAGASGWVGSVDFGDLSPAAAVTSAADGSFQVGHVFTSAGTYSVTVRWSNPDGRTASATLKIQIDVLELQADPNNPSQTTLVVGGTSGDDDIDVRPGKNRGDVRVFVNNQDLGTYHPSAGIIVFGQAGNDDISVSEDLRLPATLCGGAGNDTLRGGGGGDWLYGGDGNDVLRGRGGADILLGGAGDDVLFSGPGRNLLIGGAGNDTLHAAAGENVLIGGSTAYDANPAALAALFAEWTGKHDFQTRVNNLLGGTNGKAPGADRANGNSFLKVGGADATVFPDAGDVVDASAQHNLFVPPPPAQRDGKRK